MSHYLSPGPQQLLTKATASGASAISWIDGLCSRVTIAVQGNGTISAGTLVIEESYGQDSAAGEYAGTWSTLATIDLTTLTGGEQVVVHFAGSVWHLRARIGTAVSGAGGSVDVWVWGN